MTVKNIPWSNVADSTGVELQPPDHQSDTHPTEPPRPTKEKDEEVFRRSIRPKVVKH